MEKTEWDFVNYTFVEVKIIEAKQISDLCGKFANRIESKYRIHAQISIHNLKFCIVSSPRLISISNLKIYLPCLPFPTSWVFLSSYASFIEKCHTWLMGNVENKWKELCMASCLHIHSYIKREKFLGERNWNGWYGARTMLHSTRCNATFLWIMFFQHYLKSIVACTRKHLMVSLPFLSISLSLARSLARSHALTLSVSLIRSILAFL